MIDFANAIKTCVIRLFRIEKAIQKYLETAGKVNGDIFEVFNLEGYPSLDIPRHPYLDMTEDEKKVFEECFGKPYIGFATKTSFGRPIKEVLNEIEERKLLFRETIGMTKNSIFRFEIKKRGKNDVRTDSRDKKTTKADHKRSGAPKYNRKGATDKRRVPRR